METPLLTKRQLRIFDSIVDEYTKTAVPIASQSLIGKSGLRVSSATIRNEMRALEEAGFICQPHTSSGRIPTEEGYRFFVQNSIQKELSHSPAVRKMESLLPELRDEDPRMHMKSLARALASLSLNAAIVAFGPHDTYYTGVSHLFTKPEFGSLEHVAQISNIIDHLDEHIPDLFSKTLHDVTILVGSENPLSSFCSIIVTPYRHQNTDGLFGIFGPMRMDYRQNYSFVHAATRFL